MPSVFISGGGPSGLAAALLFEQLGWDEIVVAERRSGPADYEKNKSFNYLIDLRGQRLLARIGLADRLPDFGVATQQFVATTLGTDGTAQTRTVPIIDPARPVCYWTTRRALLAMLFEAIEQRAAGRITLLYGSRMSRLERAESDAGKVRVVVADASGAEQRFAPDLILACDGLNSAVRAAAQAQPDVAPGYFDMIAEPSLSTGLRYKVLNLPATFSSADGRVDLSDHRMSYIFPGRHKDRRKACALFAFPVIAPDQPRSVNVIREADHHLWTITDPAELVAFLDDAFPQLDMKRLVPPEEAADFVSLEAGTFPAPQYARNLHAAIGPPGSRVQIVLIGDAAHAFPPDLGLGVNSALEDLILLDQHLARTEPLEAAVKAYAAERLPEARDLAWMVRHTFPEQYNHRPWRLRLWAAGFVLRRILNRAAPSSFDKPAFHLSQDPDLSFSEMRRRKERTDRRVRLLGAGMAAAALAAGLALRS